ncbi:glutamine--tRNA ligase/YqeY domain fusion protein [Haliea sp. AH-315-K21]|uniref:Glutamine--tRNA ligase n=1 Tax=SAR86 cluster bacterium TaxID=2030880 RepID=A0A2A5C867_9GAMM|nr:glutamine--tRNA ligase/YqeY domain fusion protein [Haliea sp. AH-315-K21]PCJ40002.1 MAG: glutamine--tRNA ligase [SAR86 cluster bacterium]
MTNSMTETPSNFIQQIIREDQKQNKHNGKVHTRFPPEPNGYLHIGHAKSICLNFTTADVFGGLCNLRFDDTNPEKESVEYINSIKDSIRWLGFDWDDREFYASSYFGRLYELAEKLIQDGKAYVCGLTPEQAREYRGSLTEPGKNSPDRDRSVDESLDLFRRMKAGEFTDGEYSLRAKIDMASPNMNMRDPMLYRIRHQHHHQTGDEWCIYPMYDFTHCISDALEGITHSLCSLEFEDHRPLYDWVLDQVDLPAHPQQIEFARLNINYTVLSKRKLKQLVDETLVSGWDDPRLPTLEGMRRRGYTPVSIRNFCENIGVTRTNSMVDVAMLEYALREDLDRTSPRAMAVLRPLKIVIEDYPEDKEEVLTPSRHPKDESMGRREIPFRRELYIERNDFEEIPPPGFKRLIAGGEVRLRGAYVIKCEEVIKDAEGNISELRCTHDAATLGAKPEGRKVKGVIHWVPVQDAVEAEIRLYDRLFIEENPDAAEGDYRDFINPDSLEILQGCMLEPSLKQAQPEERFQFEREGYFVADREDYKTDAPVFNLTVGLRDAWGKAQQKPQKK